MGPVGCDRRTISPAQWVLSFGNLAWRGRSSAVQRHSPAAPPTVH